MKIDTHIVYRFLTDESFINEILVTTFPDLENKIKEKTATEIEIETAASLFAALIPEGNKSYYITDTVTDKLDMLRVSKSKTFPIKENNEEEVIGHLDTFDWTVFKNTRSIMDEGKHKKFTFILPNNSFIRLSTSNGYMAFFFLEVTKQETPIFGRVHWVNFWVNIREEVICSHWQHQDVKDIEELIFKILCFIYLSENEEQIINAGQRYGTKKSGKIINSLPVPITVVTSKWNVTSVRTEGFDVSGHFRLQPTNTGTKMIFIQPFRKHGYTRRAKSIDET